jgi:hypothetical protein
VRRKTRRSRVHRATAGSLHAEPQCSEDHTYNHSRSTPSLRRWRMSRRLRSHAKDGGPIGSLCNCRLGSSRSHCILHVRTTVIPPPRGHLARSCGESEARATGGAKGKVAARTKGVAGGTISLPACVNAP